ncbi:MAG TPA: MASE1 domain-containing protein, partial [Gaiellaceae bacterium]|nr:MASE1 domain-containing protein [Gaiellaceae bacterium]
AFLRYLGGVAALAALYYSAAKIGYDLRFTGPIAGIVWLPVGVAVSFLALGGLRFWPGALLGDLLANDYSSLPLGGALGQTAGNLTEVLLGAFLLRRLVRRGSPLDSTVAVGGMLGAIALSTGVSALVGPTSLLATGGLSSSSFPSVARTWWFADACGMLVVAPVALAWFGPAPRLARHVRPTTAAAVLLFAAALAWISLEAEGHVAYLVFPALLYAAIRCGSRTSTAAVAVAAAAAVWGTSHSQGPFVVHSISRSVFSTQTFIVVAAVSTLLLTALVSEREVAIRRGEEARSHALVTQYAERQRLERDLHDGLQQRLLALRLQLRRAVKAATAAERLEIISNVDRGVHAALDEVRALARGTYPPLLTEVGLAGAVREIAARSTVRTIVEQLPSGRFDPATEAASYYVIAEAVSNAQKHALASTIRIRVGAPGNGFHITVVDDGLGGASEREDSGLAGLRTRVESFGGTFSVSSPIGHGTVVAAYVPFPRV